MSRGTRSRRRTPLTASLVGLAVVLALLASPRASHAELGPAELSLEASGRELLPASMRVGINRGLGGYSTLPERDFGRLTGNTFAWRGGTYTVTNIIQNRSRDAAGTWRVLVEFSPALDDGVEGLTLGLGDVWLNLADARGGGRLFAWTEADLEWRAGLTVPVVLCAFPKAFEARSVDGWGNNRDRPELGVPGATLLRKADVAALYGLTGSPPPDLPGPREVSNLVSAQDGSMPNAYGVTDMVWQWGQFLDHDLSLTPAAEQESLPIPIPQRDPAFNRFISGITMPFSRSAFDPSTGVTPDSPRTPINTITAFIDASNVYGSDPGRTRALRTNDGTGRLRTSHDGRLLRYNDDFLPNDDGNRGRTTALFLAGDIRANEHVGLTSMHALFVREHNRQAAIIAAENPSLMGQEIFEQDRKIVGA
ncbi:MAG: hypothetical protein F4Z60_06555, partial [Chloroflexi bacterium]|nr:hypothetical protein [Chloroflexota bacterium]